MNKILEENYGGYTAGTPLDCDINSSLSSTGGETRKIYNFSYYHPNGEPGVISISEGMTVYVSHGWNQSGEWVYTFWPQPPPWGYDYTRYWPRYLPGIGYALILAPNGNWYWSLTPIKIWYNSYIDSWENGRYAKRLAEFIDKVLAATGASKVDIVAHSMGGLVARAAIKYYGCDTKVRKLLTIGTPNKGWHGVGDSHWMQLLEGHANWQIYGED
jgi:pimeloyl-ACP methyl ester carboxylesterase